MSVDLKVGMDVLRFDDMAVGRYEAFSHTITADEVDAFGHLSGDLNPLHMDAEFAKRSPFRQRVAHGMLTAAKVSTAHTRLTGPGFVYVGQELRFLAPAFIGDTITVKVTIVETKPAKRILVMDTTVHNQRGGLLLSGLSALKELSFD